MSFPLQAKLLQVLQDGEFSRLGGKHDVQVDVRVIAATNRDLETAVADGPVPRRPLLPPERRRHQPAAAARAARGDPAPHRLLPEEVLGAVQQAARASSAPRLMRLFMEYDWPGNVRELENLIKRDGRARQRSGRSARSCSQRHRAWRRADAAAPRRRAARRAAGRRAPPTRAAPRRRRPRPVARRRPPRPPTAGNYSLKDISRTAAREAERELILQDAARRRAGTARKPPRSSASATRPSSTRSRKTASTRPRDA